MENNIKLYFVNLVLLIILVFTNLIVLNHNDFLYYGSIVSRGELYKDVYFSYPPGSFIFNKVISLLFPNNYDYVVMRFSSTFLFFISINILANSFLKKEESKIYFLFLTSLLCSFGAFEIGSYSLSFFLFVMSLVKFFFGKNNRDFFLAGFYFGLCLSTRPTYAPCVLFFLLVILKNKNFKQNFLSSTIGGLLGILPYLFYFIKDFSSLMFWNYKIHLLHNESYRWKGLLSFIKNLVVRINIDYIIMFPLLFPYFYYLFKNIYKRLFEFILLITLLFSSLVVLVVHKQYFEPLFIIIFLFMFSNVNLNNFNRFIISLIIVASVGKFLITYENLDKNKYTFKNVNSIFSVLNTKKEIKLIIDRNLKKECNLIYRTTSPVFLPYGLIHHPFNVQGVWLFRLRENLTIKSNKYIDYNNYINFYKKDFNVIIVGYYALNEYELKLIEYAIKENWKLFYTTNFKIFVKNECN